MSIWNKILLALIAVASLAFFHAAIRTVKTYQYWANSTDSFERMLKQRRQEIVGLKTADYEHPLPDKTVGVRQLHFDLARLITNRGRIWSGCEKQNVSTTREGRVQATVNTEQGDVSAQMLLYVFEEGDEQTPVGKYLGEFSVSSVNGKQIVLVSTTQPILNQVKDMQGSKTPWVLYELIPTDQHEAFVAMSDDLKKKWFPDDKPDKWFAKEFFTDGQNGPDGKPIERPLRDYLEFFRDCDSHRTLFVDRLASIKNDNSYLTAVQEDVQKQYAFAQAEKAELTKQLEWENKQLQATTDYNTSVRTLFGNNEQAVKTTIDANAKTAKEIAALQKEAADLIESRMRNMAQTGVGAN